MTDLVKRLRRGDTSPHANCRVDRCMCAIMDEAADEIERLLSEIIRLSALGDSMSGWIDNSQLGARESVYKWEGAKTRVLRDVWGRNSATLPSTPSGDRTDEPSPGDD